MNQMYFNNKKSGVHVIYFSIASQINSFIYTHTHEILRYLKASY